MLEWAPNLILTLGYKMPEIKKQLDVCLDCLSESNNRSVDWGKASQVKTDYLNEHYEPFYKFHFLCSLDGEEGDVSDEEEGSDTKKKHLTM